MTWTAITDSFWGHGNDLQISNLTIDGTQQRILADLNGSTGVGFKEQVPVWTFSSAEVTPPNAAVGALGQTVLKGLTMTEEARLLTVQAFELSFFPESDLTRVRIADWGTVTVGMAMTVVPEPSSAMLMALGCLGVVWSASARARRERSAETC